MFGLLYTSRVAFSRKPHTTPVPWNEVNPTLIVQVVRWLVDTPLLLFPWISSPAAAAAASGHGLEPR